MRLQRRSAAVIVAALFLAGCGGGGGSQTTPTAKAPTAPSTSSAAAIATGSITIKYPAGLHHAKLAAIASRGQLASTGKSKFSLRRKPTYVNSTSGDYLDIWVDGNHVIDPSDLEEGNVSSTPDGTQTFSIPLSSTAAHQIVAIETDYGIYDGDVLSVGEYDVPANSFAAGSAPVFGLTMLMNAVGIGITSDPVAGSDAETCVYSYYCYEGENPNYMQFTPNNDYICSAGDSTPSLYTFTTDPDGYFVQPAGAGVAIPTVSNWASLPVTAGNRLSAASGLGSGYTVTYPSDINTNSAVVLNMAAANPATAVYNDFYFDGGSLYPGIYNLANIGGAYYNSAVSNLLYYTIGNWNNAYNNDVFNISIEVDANCDD
ncbi:MAG: hypothetical protein ABSH03_15515 [Candidatus Lustribacter sp.]